MPLISTDYTGCTGCCGAAAPCTNDYMRDVFGTAGICSKPAVASSPVILLCEIRFDKAGATWQRPELAACLPDVIKYKIRSLNIGGPSAVGTCRTSASICTSTSAGSDPAWPGVRVYHPISTGYSNFAYLGSGTLGNNPFVNIGMMCGGSEYILSVYTGGAVSLASHVCDPFEMVFNNSFSANGYATWIAATFKYTLATDCASPYGLPSVLTDGGVPAIPSSVPLTGKTFLPLASPVVSQATTPCKHLGANIQDPVKCACGTAILRHCSVYGACRVTGTSVGGESICLTCPDYQSP